MKILLYILLLLLNFNLFSEENKLDNIYINIQNISYNFQETNNLLHHDFYPFKKTTYNLSGIIATNNNNFIKEDSLSLRNKILNSILQINNDTILFKNYGKDELLKLDSNKYFELLFESARYSPYYLVNYLINKNKINTIKNKYNLSLNNFLIEINIKKNNINQIKTIKYDEYYGNDTTIYNYINYNAYNYPEKIIINKLNNKLIDTVNLFDFKKEIKINDKLKKDSIYFIKNNQEINEKLSSEKINNKLTFINFKEANLRSLIVEFEKYLLVIEAPLNPKNGELLFNEIKKIYPNKQVKFFTFSHHHQHYTGGIREFIHNEVEIIQVEENNEYIDYLANSDHSLNPDNLFYSKKKLKYTSYKDSLKIKDSYNEIIFYQLGDKSSHTKDYTFFYFPDEKIIFLGDLIFLNQDISKRRGASLREEGIYYFLKDNNIDVNKIYISWPLENYNIITDIDFIEFENIFNKN